MSTCVRISGHSCSWVKSKKGRREYVADAVFVFFFFFQAEEGIRDSVASRGLGDVYKRKHIEVTPPPWQELYSRRLIGEELSSIPI